MAARPFALGFALAAFVALTACSPAATPPSTDTNASTLAGPQSLDGAFVGRAAMFENFEIQAADIATSQAQKPAVKTYAANEAAAHRQALADLIALAQAAHMPAPAADLDDNYRAYLDMLRNARGAAFDSIYPSQQVIAYGNAAGAYQNYAAAAPDAPLKQYAATRLTALRGGVTAARALANPS